MTVIIPDLPATPDPRELRVLRKQTKQFIKQSPTAVVIHRATKASNGKGGFTTSRSDLEAQDFRMVLGSQSNMASRNVDGEQVKPDYVLIGAWDADVVDDDTFTVDGRDYEVMFVRRLGMPATYETWVEVKYVG